MTYEIDGSRFWTFEFFEEISNVLIPGQHWGRNLDAFNDILRGGFGTPGEGFTFLWKNHCISRERLGYPETVRQLGLRLERCHPENREEVQRQLRLAQEGEGPTVFDWLIDIIRVHSPGGREEESGLNLSLT